MKKGGNCGIWGTHGKIKFSSDKEPIKNLNVNGEILFKFVFYNV